MYLDAIEPEPVEFDWHTNHRFLGSKLMWFGLSVIALALLFSQVFWLRFDTLSKKEPYRAYYASFCNTFGCALPTIIDRSQISASNLVVRSHPAVPGSLMVDAVIQNKARYEQPFPTLDLVFTNINNKPVAARRIRAQEYLGGELAGTKMMPPRQPIHIAIEIVDPGPKAVSYRISIGE